MAKLNQIIAVEKGTKTRVQHAVDVLYKAIQKPALFEGFRKTYLRKSDDEEQLPPQAQRVQMTVKNVLTETATQLKELFDVTAAKDYANCEAKADIKVGEAVIATAVPATYLLFLEKQLTDLHTMVGKLPTLDTSDDWTLDTVKELYVTEPTQTGRTKKVPKPIVLYPHSDKHPAQTQLLSEDVVVGHWEQVKFSGAATEQFKRTLLSRIEGLQRAVKFAREQANVVEAPAQSVGSNVLNWIFG